MNLENIKNAFNKSSTNSLKIGLDPFFWGFAIVAGALISPASTIVAVSVAAAPATYTGLGIAFKGIAKGIELIEPRP